MKRERNKRYDYYDNITKSYVDYFRAELINGPNYAEINALQEEEALEKKKKIKKDEYERSMLKYKENNRKFKEKKLEDALIKLKQKEEVKIQLKEKKDYNKSIKEINLKKNKREKEYKQSGNCSDICNYPNKEIKSEIINEENTNQYKAIINLNDNQKNNDDILIPSDNFDKALNTNSNEKDVNENNSSNHNAIEEKKTDYIINLRNEISELIKNTLLQQKQKQNQIKPCINSNPDNAESNEYLYNDIASNLKHISQFRKTGFKSITQSSSPIRNRELNQYILFNSNTTRQKTLQELRFHKALKQILTERLGEKNIYLPNICSCGQLQISLDTLISEKNISVYSVFNINCANNCIYYKKRHEYEKSIKDILFSVRDLTFESFFDK